MPFPPVPVLPVGYFNLTATIYTADPVTGQFTVVAASNVPVRLDRIRMGFIPENRERAEDTRRRRLTWGPASNVPEGSRVVTAGENWNVVRGTTINERWLDGSTMFTGCEVLKAQ